MREVGFRWRCGVQVEKLGFVGEGGFGCRFGVCVEAWGFKWRHGDLGKLVVVVLDV